MSRPYSIAWGLVGGQQCCGIILDNSSSTATHSGWDPPIIDTRALTQLLPSTRAIDNNDSGNVEVQQFVLGWQHALLLLTDGSAHTCDAAALRSWCAGNQNTAHTGPAPVWQMLQLPALQLHLCQALIPAPAPVPHQRVLQVAAGDAHCLLLSEQGGVWAWGCNKYGQVGWTSSTAAAAAGGGVGGAWQADGLVCSHKELQGGGQAAAAQQHGPGGQQQQQQQQQGMAMQQHASLPAVQQQWTAVQQGRLQGADGASLAQHADQVTQPVQQHSTNVQQGDLQGADGVTPAQQQQEPNWQQQQQQQQWTAVQQGRLQGTDGPSQTQHAGQVTQPVLVLGPGAAGSACQEAVAQVTAGACHSAAISAGSGRLYCWGWNAHGQCCIGSTDNVLQPQLCEALDGVPLSSVASGMAHTVCASRDGAVYACGWNSNGQLGIAGVGQAEGCADIEAAAARSAAEDDMAMERAALQDATVITRTKSIGQAAALCGGSMGKQKGTHEQRACVSRLVPELVQHPDLDEEHVVQVACGSRHTLALTASGAVFSWGWNKYGQCCLAHRSADVLQPTRVAPTQSSKSCKAIAVHAGAWHSVITDPLLN